LLGKNKVKNTFQWLWVLVNFRYTKLNPPLIQPHLSPYFTDVQLFIADGSNEKLRCSMSVDTPGCPAWLSAQGIAPSAPVLEFSIADF